MSGFSVDELLAPLSAQAPCGSDLAYDPAFVALETLSRGKPEQQFGSTVIKAEPPDWRAVADAALELARRTRDLRVAVLLARSAARTRGFEAYAAAIALTAGLLERHWEHVHPPLDADDGHDPTMRLNALAALADPATGIADLRSARVGPSATAASVRQFELAWGGAEPLAGETVGAPEGLMRALQDAEAQQAGTLAAMRQLHADVLRIEASVAEHVGAAIGPDFRPLLRLAKCLAGATLVAEGSAEAGGSAHGQGAQVALPAQAAPDAHAAPVAAGSIRSRADVIRVLDGVCDWVERYEPTNPAPLLIRRARRLMDKNFLEIMHDLAPDGVSQVEKIAGAVGSE